MAREAHDREDLLRDATALIPRAMLCVEEALGLREVFAGFRGDALSLYFGGDPVYHFNAHGELRRAFVAGRIVRAEKRRLVGLTRRESERETSLVRQEFSEAEQAAFLGELRERLNVLAAQMSSGRVAVVGEEPPEGGVLLRLAAWLTVHAEPGVAMAAGIGQRRAN
jgi:hypothetical protein